MRKEAGPGAALRKIDADVTRVLLVTAAEAPLPEWPAADGRRFRVTAAPSFTAAAALIGKLPFDVVIVDAQIAAANPAALEQMSDSLPGAGLLVRATDYTADIPAVMKHLNSAACLLPGEAPAGVQAQVVALAADRARLAAELSLRVTELERRTRELEESRSHFRDVIERNADAIVVVDREGVVRFANNVAAELFGTPRDELPGTPFGFPVTAGETTELDLLAPDGARVVEMRVVESEWEGSVAYIASLRDTTERRRAEESARSLIREQAARSAAEMAARRSRFQADAGAALSAQVDYSAAITTLARLCADEVADWAVIFIVDEQGRVSRREAAHCSPEHAAAMRRLREFPIRVDSSHPVIDVLRTRMPLLVRHADDAEHSRLAHNDSHLQLIRRLGITSYLIVPLIARGRALGAIKLVSSNPDRRFNDEDLAMATDLASRAALALDNARLYREAHEANQAKSDLLAVISHDLRTPLNAIIGYAELLTMGIPDPLNPPALAQVDRMSKSARHLLYLIDELSSYARLEAGRTKIRVKEADVHAIVQEVTAVVEPLATERGLEFRQELPEEPPVLRTDPDRVRQVLLNLTGNAVKYTSEGSITLEAEATEDGGVVFRVRDTGVGIAREHLDRVFEPFWQVDATDRANNRGSGLGLSIVRTLLSMLGGMVSVESEVGRGSTFTVRLPREIPE